MNKEDLSMLSVDDLEDAEFAREETRGARDERLQVLSENIAQAFEARSLYLRGRLDV